MGFELTTLFMGHFGCKSQDESYACIKSYTADQIRFMGVADFNPVFIIVFRKKIITCIVRRVSKVLSQSLDIFFLSYAPAWIARIYKSALSFRFRKIGICIIEVTGWMRTTQVQVRRNQRSAFFASASILQIMLSYQK